MKNLFDIWQKRVPNYNAKYEPLFNSYAKKGGGDIAEDDKLKIFDSFYEFYIYAFFIGLYHGEKESIEPGNTKHFGYSIEGWGKKKFRDLRSDFSSIQKYIFSIVIAEDSEIDFVELEKSTEENDIKQAVSLLVKVLEEYTNGGLNILQGKIGPDPNLFYKENKAPLNLILEAVSKNSTGL